MMTITTMISISVKPRCRRLGGYCLSVMNRPAFIALGLRGNHTGSPGDGMAGGGETARTAPRVRTVWPTRISRI